MKLNELNILIENTIKKILSEEDSDIAVLDKKITNPETGRKVKVSSALSYDKDNPVYQKAQSLIKKENPKEKESNNIKPINFTDDYMIDNYFNVYNDDLEKLSKDEKTTINNYRDNDYFRINKLLRGNNVEDKKEMLKSIKNIDTIFDKIKTKHDLTVYRGVEINPDSDIFKKLSNMKIGQIGVDKAYSSTSLKHTGKFSKKGGIEFKINVPKGSKAIPMQNLGDSDTRAQYEDEKEMLLPRKTKLQLKSKELKNGKLHMEFDLIPD